MKKLFKSLAVLLALVLVLGTVSAAAADTKVTLKQSTKTLFIGGSTGTKLDGTKCLTGETKQMKNMLNNFDAETMKLIVTSDDESIVSVKKTTIKGEKMGTTTVNLLVVDKTTNDPILNKNVKVTVKKNATADTIKVTGIEDEATYSVSDVLNVTMPRSGVYSDTAVLKADSDDVVITPGEKSRTWTVSFKKAGTYTITGYTFQSSTYAGTTASVDFKVTVTGTKMIGAKQISSESLAILLDGEPTAADVAETVSVYQKASNGLKIAGTKVVKKVTADGNTLVVETYGTFSKDTTYYVEYKGVEASFVGCDLTAASVAKIVLDGGLVLAGKQKALTVTAYNADGVKLTDVEPANLVFEKVAGANGTSVVGKNVYISKAGDQITVRAYFTKYADGKATKIYTDKDATFTGTTQEVATGEVIGVLKAGTVDESKPGDVQQPSEICIGDTANVQFFAEYQDVFDPSKISYKPMVNTTDTELEVLDKKVAVVAANGAITPISEGTTYILLKNSKTKEVFGSVALTISAKRYPAYFTAVPSKSNVNIASLAKETLDINIVVYDQYDKKFTGAVSNFKASNTDVTDTDMNNYILKSSLVAASAAGAAKIVVLDGSTPVGAAVADGGVKTAYIKVENTSNNDNSAKMAEQLVVVTFADFSTEAIYGDNKVAVGAYEISGMKNVDTALTADSKTSVNDGGVDTLNFDITFNAMYAGYKLYALDSANAGLKAVDAAPVSKEATGATGTHFEIVVTTPDGVVTDDTTNIDFNLATGKISVTPVKYTGAGNLITKIKAGTYTVDLYEVKESDDDTVGTIVSLVDSKSFTVSDNQGRVVAVQKSEHYGNASGDTGIFNACFELSMNGATKGLAVEIVDSSKIHPEGTTKVYGDGSIKAKLTTGFGYILLPVDNLPVVCFK